MNTTDAKTRLVQQLARLDKLDSDLQASHKRNARDARQRIGEIDVRLDKLRPVVAAWIKANFTPDTPALRAVAEEYCSLTEERYDCLLAEGIATGDGGGEDDEESADDTPTELSNARP